MNSSLSLPPTVPLAGPCVRNDPTFHWVILAICGAVLVAAGMLTIRESGVVIPVFNQPLPELCALRRFTGLCCPGCGLTRCFISVAHGDVAAAWSFNPAGLWLFVIIAAQLPLRSYQLWRVRHGRRELQLASWGAIAFGVFLVALLSQWALRLVSMFL
jgi:hypothetical protein